LTCFDARHIIIFEMEMIYKRNLVVLKIFIKRPFSSGISSKEAT